MSSDNITVSISGATIYDAAGKVTDNTFSISGFTCADGTVLFDEVAITGAVSENNWVPNDKNNKNGANVVIGNSFSKSYSNSTTDIPLVYYDVTVDGVSGGHAVQNDGQTYIIGGKYLNNTNTGSTGTGGAVFRSRGKTADVFVIMAKTEIIDGKEVKTGTLLHGNTMTTGMGGAIHSFQDGTKWYIDGATFSNNAALIGSTAGGQYGGGAITQQSSPYFLVQNSFFNDNYAVNVGGAISTMISGNTTAVYGTAFSGNAAEVKGGAISVYRGILISKDNLYSENESAEGGAIYIDNNDTNTITVTGDEFSCNVAASNGGAIYTEKVVSITDTEFKYNYSGKLGGAIYFAGSTASTVTRCTFTGNTAYDDRGGAMALAANVVLTITNSKFIENIAHNKNGGAIRSNGDITIIGSTFTGNEAKGLFKTSSTTFGWGGAVNIDNGSADISNTIFNGNKALRGGGAIYVNKNSAVVNIANTKFLKASDTIHSIGTINFSGNITLNADLTGEGGTWNIAEGTKFTLGKDINLNGVDFSNATITVDGTDLAAGDVIATNVGGIGNYVINNKANAYLELAVVNDNLVAKELDSAIADNEVKDSFSGTGTTVISGGTVNTFIGQKTSDADLIAVKFNGGKVDGNLIGGAWAKAGKTLAEINRTELNIGGSADVKGQVYAGGYFYGLGGSTTAALDAQMSVYSVNITLDGNAKVTGNLFGGIHARQNANVKVDDHVSITVNGGEYDRIYAGGWAEGYSYSSVTRSYIYVSSGSVNYIYGGGANGLGETYVGETTITIDAEAKVGTIHMGGRYGNSYADKVELNWFSNNSMKRLSGLSSAGVDNTYETTVNLFADMNVNTVDYVDMFVFSEGKKLIVNDEFLLGNRDYETQTVEPDTFTTFDITAGNESWDVIAGLSEDQFAHAIFIVNGNEFDLWDDSDSISDGDYILTRREEDGKFIVNIAKA